MLSRKDERPLLRWPFFYIELSIRFIVILSLCCYLWLVFNFVQIVFSSLFISNTQWTWLSLSWSHAIQFDGYSPETRYFHFLVGQTTGQIMRETKIKRKKYTKTISVKNVFLIGFGSIVAARPRVRIKQTETEPPVSMHLNLDCLLAG